MKKKNNLSQKTYLLLPILTIAVLLLLGKNFFLPSLNKAKAIRKDNQALIARKQRMDEKVTELGSLDKEALKKQVESLMEIVPTEKDPATLIAVLKKSAEEYNLDLGAFKLDPGEIGTAEADLARVEKTDTKAEKSKKSTKSLLYQVEEALLSLNIVGEEEDVLKWLSSLSQTAPLVKISSFHIVYANDSDKTSLAINCQYFFNKLPEVLGAIDAPLPEISNDELALIRSMEIIKKYPKATVFATAGQEDIF